LWKSRDWKVRGFCWILFGAGGTYSAAVKRKVEPSANAFPVGPERWMLRGVFICFGKPKIFKPTA
jgi:hypothetical protein